jgi:hypothetical protein
MKNRSLLSAGLATLLLAVLFVAFDAPPAEEQRSWLAGDHHIHGEFSVGWDRSTNPPTPILGGDARYSTSTNAEMAKAHGLSWMVTTDHGGPNHSKLNLEQAYPALVKSRAGIPDLIQFYGMELDTPGAEHTSMIIPRFAGEADMLFDLESRFAKHDVHPRDDSRYTEERMIEAVAYMSRLPLLPVLIVNHPSRSASGLGEYGLVDPGELRNWNDAGPRVAVGMEGAPGHQARALRPDGSLKPEAPRGGYGNYPTMGGFDQMTARLGGFWDSMLGEGRRWWVTATSDSHVHWREGGSDFWPGEYSKTYVFAAKTYDDVLDGLRNGRIFVTTGDLISELSLEAGCDGCETTSIGGTLTLPATRDVQVTIRVREPETPNHRGDNPRVARVDLITGRITGPAADRALDRNETTRVAARFSEGDWTRDGEYLTMQYVLRNVDSDHYIRVRGTNTDELEPEVDPPGEDPWQDLWFYSNPVFIEFGR